MTNKVAEVITNKILESVKTSGELPWQKPWRTTTLRNAVSGKDYRGVNVIMLAILGNDSDFITFNQAKDNGGMVKKGSKGIPICFFKFMDKKDKAGNVVTNGKGEAAKWPLLRYSTVFNLSDIDGCEALKAKAAERKKTIDFTPIEACEKLASAYSISITHGGNRAYYSPAIHAIGMPEKESFKSVEAYYATLFHEIGHSLSREMGEDISNGFGSDPYAKEELVAELFANFCLSYVGVTTTGLFDNSVAYFQSWLGKLTDDPTLLISAASKASKRFNWLLNKAGLTVEETETAEAIAA